MGTAAAFLAGAAAGGAAAWWLALRRTRRYGRLFSFAMHELNTPVTAVNMTVMNLLSGVFGPLPPEMVKWVEMSRDQLGRMSALVGDLRDLIHMELHGELRPQLEEADPAELLQDALRAPLKGFEHAGVPLRVAADSGLPKVRADSERAARSLQSLLNHARKFRAGGEIALRARRDGDFVAFELDYQGRTLPPEELDRSLELFYPALPRRDQVLCATGLGLGLSRVLAERLGGELDFDSDERGRARLSLRLPVAQGAA